MINKTSLFPIAQPQPLMLGLSADQKGLRILLFRGRLTPAAGRTTVTYTAILQRTLRKSLDHCLRRGQS